MNFKNIRENSTQAEVQKMLGLKAVWTVQDSAGYLGITTSFYRRNLLGLPDHPTPIDSNSKNLQWWGAEMVPFLSDWSNLKWPEGKTRKGTAARETVST